MAEGVCQGEESSPGFSTAGAFLVPPGNILAVPKYSPVAGLGRLLLWQHCCCCLAFSSSLLTQCPPGPATLCAVPYNLRQQHGIWERLGGISCARGCCYCVPWLGSSGCSQLMWLPSQCLINWYKWLEQVGRVCILSLSAGPGMVEQWACSRGDSGAAAEAGLGKGNVWGIPGWSSKRPPLLLLGSVSAEGSGNRGWLPFLSLCS